MLFISLELCTIARKLLIASNAARHSNAAQLCPLIYWFIRILGRIRANIVANVFIRNRTWRNTLTSTRVSRKSSHILIQDAALCSRKMCFTTLPNLQNICLINNQIKNFSKDDYQTSLKQNKSSKFPLSWIRVHLSSLSEATLLVVASSAENHRILHMMILCWLAADGNAASNKVRCASKAAFEVATQSRPEPPAEDGGCFSFFFLVLFWIWPPDMGCHCARLIWFSFEVWGSAPTIGWANISLFVFSWFLEGIKVFLYVGDFCLWKQWTLCTNSLSNG